MKLEVQGGQLGELADNLARYSEITGKKLGDVIAREGREMGWALYTEAKKISPKPSQIIREAEARSFAMGRRSNRLTRATLGVSLGARNRAVRLLGGEKADYFKVNRNGEGMLSVRPVRFSARKFQKRITKLSKLLRGGRFGNKFAPSALRSSQVAGHELKSALNSNPEIKKLNVGALAAAIEVSNRQRAAKGGLMAVQWLPRVFKRRSSSVVKKGPLVVNSMAPGKGEIGRVDFINNGDVVEGVNLTGKVPNTDIAIERHGLLTKAIRSRIADRQVYIRRKLAEANAEAFRQLLS